MSTLRVKHFNFIEDLDIAALTFAAVERVEGFAANITQVAKTWVSRSHERRQLAQMNSRMLDDIGLTPADVDRETSKFFWQK